MKALYKCDFCDMTGTEEDIREHEIYCENNPARMSCQYCEYKKTNFVNGKGRYECKFKDIPEGQQYMNCDKFALKKMTNISMEDLFGSFFPKRYKYENLD